MLRSDQLLKAHNSLIKNETQEKKRGGKTRKTHLYHINKAVNQAKQTKKIWFTLSMFDSMDLKNPRGESPAGFARAYLKLGSCCREDSAKGFDGGVLELTAVSLFEDVVAGVDGDDSDGLSEANRRE